MRRFFWFVTSHPVLVLCLAGLVGLVLGPFVLSLTRDTSPDAFIPQDHPALRLKKQVEEDFGLTEPIAVGVIRAQPGGIFVPETLKLIQTLTRAIQGLPGIDPDDVLSLTTESGVYFDENDEPGFELLVKEIPTPTADLEALKADVLGYELYKGTLVAEDGSAACILIRPENENQADRIYRALADLLDGYPVNDEQLVVAGEAAVRAHMGTAVSDDALRMNFICPIVMAILIILAYRTVRGTVLPLCVIGGASIMALGLMAVFGVPVYIVTNGIFVIIMALGVADSLHLIGQYYEEQLEPRGRSKQEIIVEACLALWYPILITSLTDVAGFFALYVAGIMPPIRYFGLFTCAGVLGALVFSYTVVPAGLMMRPLKMSSAFLKRKNAASQTNGVDAIGRIMGRLGTIIFRRRFIVLGLGIITIAFAAWGASKLIINDARILAFKEHHPIVRAARALNARFDGTSQLNIIVTASEPEALLQTELLHRLDELETYTEALPHVGGTHSPAGWIKRAHQKMHDEDPAYYVIPDDPFETQFYLDVLGIETSPMAELLHEVIDETYTRANLIVRMKSSEFIHQREVIHTLQDYLDEHFSDGPLRAKLAGRVNLDYHWLCMIRTSHVNSVVLSFICVLVLTGLMFRSVIAGFLCTLTVGVAVLVNYAIMGLGGIPLGVGTSMFASIAIGAGVNFPIHMLDRLRIGLSTPDADPAQVFRNAFAFTGRVLFFTAFVVALGFLLLCVSEFRTLVRFGLLIGIGLLVSFLTSVTLLPALVAILKPRFLWKA
ncbi:MAG: MMPL family transporter [Phycisphaerae bacterium]|nr:MMPL family transporter [Phycisphaerae bacterium]